MVRVSILLLPVMLAACAVEQREITRLPLTAPRQPRIDGDVNAVSDGDIRIVLSLMRARARERSLPRPTPLYRIHVIDRNTMRLHFWIPGSDIWTYARRIKGRWHVDYADSERVIITGNELPTG